MSTTWLPSLVSNPRDQAILSEIDQKRLFGEKTLHVLISADIPAS